MADEDILHQDDVEGVINEEIEEGVGKDNAAIADFVPLTGGESPTEAEFNALGAKVNAVLDVLRGAGQVDEA